MNIAEMHLYRKGEASQIERGGTTRKEWSLLTHHTLLRWIHLIRLHEF